MSMWIVVYGQGSFSLGPNSKIWRGPRAYEITDEQAAECLAWKDDHPGATHFTISAEEPYFEPPEPLTGTLRPEDLYWNRRTADDDAADPVEPEYTPAPDEYHCAECDLIFPTEPGLERHVMVNHSDTHLRIEQEAREALAAAKERKATEERVRQADTKIVRPEERPPDARPSLMLTLTDGPD